MNDKLKALRKLVKEFGEYSIHAFAHPNRESWEDRAVFEFRGHARTAAGEPERSAVVVLQGIIRNGHTSRLEHYVYEGKEYPKYPDAYRPTDGYWGTIYRDNIEGILAGFPNDAEPELEIALDSGTNELSMRVKIHTDFLYMHAKRDTPDKKRYRYLIDTATCLHNTARFGTPQHEADQGGRGVR